MNRVTIFLSAFILILGISAQKNNENNSPTKSVEIECYTCSNCETVTNITASKICPLDPSDPSPRQKCVTFVEKYEDFQDQYIRGCVSERGNCKNIKELHDEITGITVLDCKECTGDRCNFDTMTQSIPMIIAFCSLVIVPLLKVYALS